MKQTRDGGDDRTQDFQIEFMGGPFDGHKLPCAARPLHLPADIIWFVCDDVFRLFAGKVGPPDGSINSVALYKLEAGGGACRYRFAGTASAAQLIPAVADTAICVPMEGNN